MNSADMARIMHNLTTEEIIKLVKKKNLNFVSYRDSCGWTFLMMVVWLERDHLIEILVDAGAPLEVKNNKKLTVLHNAWDEDRLDAMKILFTKGAVFSIHKVFGGNSKSEVFTPEDIPAKFEILLDSGVSVDARNESNGFTLLMYACKHGLTNSICFLLQAGAGEYIENFDRKSALDICKKYSWVWNHLATIQPSPEIRKNRFYNTKVKSLSMQDHCWMSIIRNNIDQSTIPSHLIELHKNSENRLLLTKYPFIFDNFKKRQRQIPAIEDHKH